MKTLLASIFLACAATSSADEIKLKSGKILVGDIVEETSKDITIRYSVSEGIKDWRTIKKRDIVKITKVSAALTAFQKLKLHLPTPDGMPVSWYNNLINKHFETYLKTYPTSKYLPKVNKMLRELQNEREAIKKGGLKFQGELLSKAQVSQNYYDLYANQLYIELKSAARAQDYNTALRKFELMEKNYPLSSYTHQAVAKVSRFTTTYLQQLKRLKAQHANTVARYKANLVRLSPTRKSAIKRAMDLSKSQHERQYNYDEKYLKTDWRHVHAHDLKSIEFAIEAVTKLRETLPAKQAKENPDGGLYYYAAHKKIAAGDIDKAKQIIEYLAAINFPKTKVVELRFLTKKRQRQLVREAKLARMKKSNAHATMEDVIQEEEQNKKTSVFE